MKLNRQCLYQELNPTCSLATHLGHSPHVLYIVIHMLCICRVSLAYSHIINMPPCHYIPFITFSHILYYISLANALFVYSLIAILGNFCNLSWCLIVYMCDHTQENQAQRGACKRQEKINLLPKKVFEIL